MDKRGDRECLNRLDEGVEDADNGTDGLGVGEGDNSDPCKAEGCVLALETTSGLRGKMQA